MSIPVILGFLNLILHSTCQLVNQQPNSWSSSFPPIDQIGYLGPTQYGSEPNLIDSTTQPKVDNHYPILEPNITNPDGQEPFIISRNWGNLSPMYSLPQDTFGIISGPQIPPDCKLNQLHLVHRHGARYPTHGTLLPSFGKMIRSAQLAGNLKSTGDLAFLKTWKYKLGSEVLTPFGRSQMFQLGVSYRQKYGFLLPFESDQPNDENELLVFRTTSQHRMYHSALNFASGFFGSPVEGKYHQSILIENPHFNNSLAPYYTCPNAQSSRSSGPRASKIWQETSLKSTRTRLNRLVSGIQFSISDINTMQNLCAYESVALGTSDFCKLFTAEEWKDFTYANDLEFWYSSSFGAPSSAALGAGWAEELLARLTKVAPKQAMTSINLTLDSNPETFPLDQNIYVDATHDTVLTSIFVALNFTSLAKSGPLPTNKRLEPRSFITSQITPFGTQLAAQVLTCPVAAQSTSTNEHIRFILNDAVIPINGLDGCIPDQLNGMCSLKSFISGLKTRLTEINYQKTCFGH